MRKTPYQPAGEKNKLGARYQGPLKIVSADSNGVTYKAQWLAGKMNIIQVHISQIKKFHGEWVDSGIKVNTKSVGSPKTKKKILESPIGGAFDIDWEKLKHIPFMPDAEVVIPEDAGSSGVLGGADLNGMVGDLVVVEGNGVKEEPIQALIDDSVSDVGSWPVSPDTADISSDYCIDLAPSSTPVRSRLPPWDELGENNSNAPPIVPLQRTRARTRAMRLAALNVPPINLNLSGESTESDNFLSGYLEERAETNDCLDVGLEGEQGSSEMRAASYRSEVEGIWDVNVSCVIESDSEESESGHSEIQGLNLQKETFRNYYSLVQVPFGNEHEEVSEDSASMDGCVGCTKCTLC